MTFDDSSTAAQVVAGHDLSGKKAIVTGAGSGLGIETAKALALAGAHIVLAVRDRAAGERVAAAIREQRPDARVEVGILDLSRSASIRAFAAAHASEPLAILINNAGVMVTPLGWTEDGLETQIGINHFGHFLLARELAGALERAAPARVVSLSSIGHVQSPVVFEDIHYRHRPYEKWQAYAQSKTANVLFAVELTRRWGGRGVTANAVMPGGIMTNLQREMSRKEMIAMQFIDENDTPHPMFKTPEQGAATSVWAATAPELDRVGGLYLEDCAIAAPWSEDQPYRGFAPHAVDSDASARLWEISEDFAARGDQP
ncbi:SDR family NAD(P)-dependent oxidoreductase [Novosphingobium sp. Gsoil 351]|uniref:SDR family NAD(P)-dependent oxidoreductase n=1 Tax=Novosphingobium sp. Gsoil 351 TaxID=2675225 RepID=UPI0012B4C9A1|nr:SDR family NAD(P)-dependent oxidoreductase [Novosphingobium sp. Gsoil 351]QGN55504.1 SDR family NAD(P)-dependent oxidoreductase [Novosphingobium sp. Gsoil 351]